MTSAARAADPARVIICNREEDDEEEEEEEEEEEDVAEEEVGGRKEWRMPSRSCESWRRGW